MSRMSYEKVTLVLDRYLDFEGKTATTATSLLADTQRRDLAFKMLTVHHLLQVDGNIHNTTLSLIHI